MNDTEIQSIRDQADLDQRIAAIREAGRSFMHWYAGATEHLNRHGDPECDRCVWLVNALARAFDAIEQEAA